MRFIFVLACLCLLTGCMEVNYSPPSQNDDDFEHAKVIRAVDGDTGCWELLG